MKNKTNNFISKLEKILVDSEIKELIINKINFYSANAKLQIHNDELYGTYINKCDLNRATPAKEFLEIKILDSNVVCNFSELSNRKLVNIAQNTLKGGHTSISKKETIKEFTCNNNNEFSVEEQERIYNYQNRLVYESNLKRQSDFDTYPYADSNIIYNTACFDNEFSLEREWYTPEGVRIKYNLSKSFVNKDDGICERYLICPGVCWTETDRVFKFVKLDKELFKSFMSGEITIDEVLDKNSAQKNYQKIRGSEIFKI